MVRKILGGFLFVLATLVLIGSISNGSFMSDRGSSAATYGAFVGTMLPIVANVLAGIFLIRFDDVCKKRTLKDLKREKSNVLKLFYSL